jgi:ATP-binding cassette, subfamily C, bacterial
MMEKAFSKSIGSRQGTLRLYVRTLVGVASWRVALALILALCVSVTQGVQLLLLVPLMSLAGLEVQQGSVGRLNEVVSSLFAVVDVRPSAVTVLIAFALFTIALAALTRWRTVYSYRLQENFASSLRRRLYRAIANVDWLVFARSRSSDFTHALTIELDRVGAATALFLSLITNAILVLVYTLLALRLDAVMTIVVFLSGAGLLLALKRKTRSAQWTGEEVSLATNGLYAAAIEHLGGMKTVKSYGAEERSSRLFSKLAERVARIRFKTVRDQADAGFWFSAGSVTILCIILYVAFEILTIPAAGLLLLLYLFNRITPLLSSIQQSYQQCLNVVPAFAKMMEILAECEAAAESGAERSEEVELRDSIRLEGVSFSYRGGGTTAAIRDLDLTIRAGETTAIVGPSGAGKSTIADLIMGLVVPTRGRVLIGDAPLGPELLRSWRSQIGYVAQDTFLFNDTVRANLLWARPGADSEEVWRALKLAAAERFVSDLPEGLETVLGDRGVRLSGGERQRLALARALLRDPSLLILDEATSALDSENERRIQEAIEGLHGCMTILVITHRLSAIRGADNIHVLESGRLVESGRWESLVAEEGGRFSALARAQKIVHSSEQPAQP